MSTQFHRRNSNGFVLRILVAICVSIAAGHAMAQQPSGAATDSAATPSATGTQSSQTAQPVQAGPNGTFTIRTHVTEVVLYATVVDNHQHLVTTLHKQDFSVYEDSVPQTISSFREEDVPVSLAILVDNSASMQQKRAAVNLAAIDLVRASNPQDESFIVNSPRT
jgi:Ca-activated chloride channel family protein